MAKKKIDFYVPQITSVDVANKSLAAASSTLSRALEMTLDASLIARVAGLQGALRDLVDGVARFVDRTRKSLPTSPAATLTNQQRLAVSGCIVQAEDALRAVDQAVKDPGLQLLPAFTEGISSALHVVSSAAAGAVGAVAVGLSPVLIPALVIGVIVLVAAVKLKVL